MPAQRKLTDRTKGMFAGQATDIGQYDDSNLGMTSGTQPYELQQQTRGEQTPSNFAMNQWPYMVSGQTNYDPSYSGPGTNLAAVQFGSQELAVNAGLGNIETGNPSGLTGMPSNI
jgi:hypothetical protein